MRKRREEKERGEDERCSDWDARREMKLRQLRMAIHIQRREEEEKEKEEEGRKNQKLQVQDSGFLFFLSKLMNISKNKLQDSF